MQVGSVTAVAPIMNVLATLPLIRPTSTLFVRRSTGFRKYWPLARITERLRSKSMVKLTTPPAATVKPCASLRPVSSPLGIVSVCTLPSERVMVLRVEATKRRIQA
jgi:hypothetical protein